jgi:hypothetical protein
MNAHKTIIIVTLLVIGLFGQQIVWGQGTTYLSNLGQPTGSIFPVASDKWIAQSFGTGTNSDGYILNSVQLLTEASSGNPSGFVVSIYDYMAGLVPASSLGSLSGSDPAAGGVFTYTASGITLSPSTPYFVVVTSTTPSVQGVYNWGIANGLTSINNGWINTGVYAFSINGSNWNPGRGSVFQFAINATPIPEPSASLLLLLGSWVLIYARRIKKHFRK